jgi:hypothetical protein
MRQPFLDRYDLNLQNLLRCRPGISNQCDLPLFFMQSVASPLRKFRGTGSKHDAELQVHVREQNFTSELPCISQ